MSFREWEKFKISELYHISSGLSKSRKDFGFGNPFVTFKDVFYNYFLPERLDNLANTNEKEIRSCSVKKGDLFLTRTSETQSDLGMSCVALKDYENATFNGFTKRLRVKEQFKDRIDPTYIGYYMRGPKVRNQINGFSIMTTRASLNNSMINLLEIEIPPIEEQKRIGIILKSIDDKIFINNQINKTLERMAQAIFKQWFVDFEFPNEDGEPYQSSGGEMVESELGLVPKGWGVTELQDIAAITMGQSPKGTSYNENSEGMVFYQGRTDFNKRFPERRLYTTEPKRIAKKGDVLLSVRAPVGDLNIANEECCIGRGLGSLRSKSGFDSYLLYTMFKLKEKFDVFNGEGTVFGSINKNDLCSLKIIKAPEDIIGQFEKVVSFFDKQIYTLEMESRNLARIRDELLPRLMSGEVRISSK